MGSGSCSCLVMLGSYSMLVSIPFVVVTVLYSTSESSICSNKVSDNAHVKKLVYVDLLNYDNIHNGEDKGMRQEVDEDEMQHTVLCDCG